MKKAAVLSALFALIASPASASASAVGPVGSPTVHKTEIACFVPETNRYVGKVEPSKCEIWGRVEFVGFLEGENTEEF